MAQPLPSFLWEAVIEEERSANILITFKHSSEKFSQRVANEQHLQPVHRQVCASIKRFDI